MKMKKIVSALLVLALFGAMLLSLSGCGGNAPLAGAWEATIDMTEFINGQLGDEEMEKYIKIEDFSLNYRMTFKEDGTYEAAVDEESAKKMYAKAKEAFKSGATAYLQAMIDSAGGGYTVDDLLSLSGTTLDAMVDQAFSEENLNTMMESLTNKGNYEAEEGKLYLSKSEDYAVDKEVYELFEISGNKLTIEKGTAEDVELDGFSIYPMEFEKVQ